MSLDMMEKVVVRFVAVTFQDFIGKCLFSECMAEVCVVNIIVSASRSADLWCSDSRKIITNKI